MKITLRMDLLFLQRINFDSGVCIVCEEGEDQKTRLKIYIPSFSDDLFMINQINQAQQLPILLPLLYGNSR